MQKAKELKTARNLLGLTETKKNVCFRLKPMSDSDSSENLLLNLNDDNDDEELNEGG